MRIAQITDPHMTAGPPEAGGYDSAAAFAAVLDQVAALRPDLVLLTGDVAANGLPEEYRRVRAAIAGVGVPIAAVPGNHDERTAFARGMAGDGITIGPGPDLWFSIEDGPVRLLGLDTLAPEGSESGVLGERQLAWVADRLAVDDRRPVLIFMHHPPFSVGLPLDWTRCGDGDDLGALVLGHPRVLGVVCGHVHRAVRIAWAGTSGGVCPPVAWELPLDLPSGALPYLVPQSPAFQLHVFDPEFGLVSHTEYVTGRGAAADFPAAGTQPSLPPNHWRR